MVSGVGRITPTELPCAVLTRVENGLRCSAAGTEVGFALVRASPVVSLTGGPLSTRNCRRWMEIARMGEHILEHVR